MIRLSKPFQLLNKGFQELGVQPDGLLFGAATYTIFYDAFVGFDSYAADGTLLTESKVPHGDFSRTSFDDVVALTGGGYAALHYFGAGSSTPFVRLYDGSGAPLTEYLDVPVVGGDTGGAFERAGSISATPDGGFVVMIGDDVSNASETATISDLVFGTRNRGADVRVVEFNADGEFVRDPYIAHETAEPTSWTDANYANSGAVLSDGRLAVAYTNHTYGSINSDFNLDAGVGIAVSLIKDGAHVREIEVYVPPILPNHLGTPTFQAQSPAPTQRGFAPYTVALDTGGFAVLYAHSEVDTSLPVRWVAAFYSADGSLTGSVDLSSGGGFARGTSNNLEIEALSDGQIAVASSLNTGLNSRKIFLKVLDETGTLDAVKVTKVDVAHGDSGLDGLDVGPDGSFYVSLTTKEVHRLALDDELIRPADGATRGDDAVLGRKRGDVLSLKAGDDVAFGKGGADQISGGKGADLLEGQAGKDELKGQGGRDQILGGAGDDIILGGNGNDILVGGNGDDQIDGGRGNDRIWGSDGDDTIIGGAGSDYIAGGAGNDELIGGGGPDDFLFEEGADTIIGFSDNTDTLILSDDLWFGEKTRKEVVDEFGSKISKGLFLFDFGDAGSIEIESDFNRIGKFVNDLEII